MLRVFRAAMITALIAALPLGASSQEMQGGGMTGGMSGGAGCTQTAVLPLVQQIFGSYAIAQHGAGHATGKTVGGDMWTASVVGCRFMRPAEMLFFESTFTNKASKIFDDSKHSMVPRENGSVHLAEAPGHVIAYDGGAIVDVRWILLRDGASNPAVPGSALEPLAMALLCTHDMTKSAVTSC